MPGLIWTGRGNRGDRNPPYGRFVSDLEFPSFTVRLLFFTFVAAQVIMLSFLVRIFLLLLIHQVVQPYAIICCGQSYTSLGPLLYTLYTLDFPEVVHQEDCPHNPDLLNVQNFTPTGF